MRGVEHDKPVLRSESCGGLTRASAETRAKSSGGVAGAIAKTLVALRAALAHLTALDVELCEPACSGRTAAADGLAELLETMELYPRWTVRDDAAAAALAAWAVDDALAPPTDDGQGSRLVVDVH